MSHLILYQVVFFRLSRTFYPAAMRKLADLAAALCRKCRKASAAAEFEPAGARQGLPAACRMFAGAACRRAQNMPKA
ncbi:hypothetical protein [Uliginosibacterium paludis]|uniref:hypothetical protein n=1 Tax=Uliginosibacterium paludis TaxID=1615952 RepID=UPI0031F61336